MMKSVVATALLATAVLAQDENTKTYTVDLTVAANKTAFDAAIAPATTEPEKAAGACNGLLNIVNEVKIGDATVTVFEPKVALADACATALKVDNKEIFTAYNGLCLTAQADPATGFDFTANKGGQLCPIAQDAKCVKDQYCAGVDGAAAAVCPVGDKTEGTCPKDKEPEPVVPAGAMQTTMKCNDVCSEPFVIDAAYTTCWKSVVKDEGDNKILTDYTAKCSTPQLFTGYVAPANKKRTEMVTTNGFATKNDAQNCVDYIKQKIEAPMKTCLDAANTKASASYEAIELKEACVDTTAKAIVCKAANKECNILCKDGTDCTANKDVCGGECVEGATEGKKECTSAATQLVAGVVAVAALAVAFF